jgi:hypothetical protein
MRRSACQRRSETEHSSWECRNKLAQRYGNALDRVFIEESRFVARRLLGQNGPMLLGGTLDDLVSEEPIQLF